MGDVKKAGKKIGKFAKKLYHKPLKTMASLAAEVGPYMAIAGGIPGVAGLLEGILGEGIAGMMLGSGNQLRKVVGLDPLKASWGKSALGAIGYGDVLDPLGKKVTTVASDYAQGGISGASRISGGATDLMQTMMGPTEKMPGMYEATISKYSPEMQGLIKDVTGIGNVSFGGGPATRIVDTVGAIQQAARPTGVVGGSNIVAHPPGEFNPERPWEGGGFPGRTTGGIPSPAQGLLDRLIPDKWQGVFGDILSAYQWYDKEFGGGRGDGTDGYYDDLMAAQGRQYNRALNQAFSDIGEQYARRGITRGTMPMQTMTRAALEGAERLADAQITGATVPFMQNQSENIRHANWIASQLEIAWMGDERGYYEINAGLREAEMQGNAEYWKMVAEQIKNTDAGQAYLDRLKQGNADEQAMANRLEAMIDQLNQPSVGNIYGDLGPIGQNADGSYIY